MTKSNQPAPNAFYAPSLLPAIEELLARGFERERIEAVFRRSLYELRTPFMRVPLLLSRRFWALAQQSNDPLIGLAAGRRFLSTSTNGLTYLFDVAASLESACRYFVRFFPFFNGHFHAEVVRVDEGVELRLHDCGSLKATPAMTDYILISLCSMLRRKLLASGLEQDPIEAIGLTFPRPAEHQAYVQAFRAPVLWQQPCHVIRLRPALFVQPLTPGNHMLEQTLVELLETTRRNSETTLLDLVCNHLVAQLANNARWEDFCAAQHMLERTAARRLKALGWSFSELLDEYRRYRAEDLLQGPGLELVEISDRLGYSDVQSFNRACLRWFGVAPGVYRSRLG
ncbi:AraC family transcriptional regulator [Pseudomonas akapageensis]|uniref:AraC family transcriptional regulator n=1 Tax=Pseudomonas akapageensis TaxID=2609961 RepID=UPI00140A8216|nr:AraC family transcriptional regulator [Pseudomonas akapageensis]